MVISMLPLLHLYEARENVKAKRDKREQEWISRIVI